MNEAERIAQALAQVQGIASVTRGWPRQTARLPCLAIGLEESSVADTRDNAVYLTKTIYLLRIFAPVMETCDALQTPVTEAMQTLGYSLIRTLEAGGETAQMLMTFHRLY